VEIFSSYQYIAFKNSACANIRINIIKMSLFKIFILVFFAISDPSHSEDAQKKERLEFLLGGYFDSYGANNNQKSQYSQNYLPNNPNTDHNVLDTTNKNNGFKFHHESRIDVKVAGVTKSDIKYGAAAMFNPINTNNDHDYLGISNQNYLFVEANHGLIELGMTYSSASKMRVDASTIARASGGIGGQQWWKYVSMPTFDTIGLSSDTANMLAIGNAPSFIMAPMLPNEAGFTTGISSSNFTYQSTPLNSNGMYDVKYANQNQPRFGWGATSNKISFYTPEIDGWSFGFSYSPDTNIYGGLNGAQSSYAKNSFGQYIQHGGNIANRSGGVRNLMTFATKYAKQWDDLSLLWSFTAEKGQAAPIINPFGTNPGTCTSGTNCINGFNGRYDLFAWNTGFNLFYGGLAFAASYGDWGNSLQYKANNTTNASGSFLFPAFAITNSSGQAIDSKPRSNYYTLGAGYGIGPINTSVTSLSSNYAGNKMSALSFGMDYKFGGRAKRGILFYTEYTLFSMDARGIFIQDAGSSTGIYYKPLKNNGYVWLTGIKLIF
jgi:hypothetical protein